MRVSVENKIIFDCTAGAVVRRGRHHLFLMDCGIHGDKINNIIISPVILAGVALMYLYK